MTQGRVIRCMQNEKMVHMANQIVAYFNVYPPERARAEVLNHLRSFWEPRMRAQLVEYVSGGGEGLYPLAQWAARRLGAPESRER